VRLKLTARNLSEVDAEQRAVLQKRQIEWQRLAIGFCTGSADDFQEEDLIASTEA